MAWVTHSVYVDVETGEQLDEYIALCNYKIINKQIKTQYNATTDRGTKHITNECKRTTQLSLFGDNIQT